MVAIRFSMKIPYFFYVLRDLWLFFAKLVMMCYKYTLAANLAQFINKIRGYRHGFRRGS